MKEEIIVHYNDITKGYVKFNEINYDDYLGTVFYAILRDLLKLSQLMLNERKSRNSFDYELTYIQNRDYYYIGLIITQSRTHYYVHLLAKYVYIVVRGSCRDTQQLAMCGG